MTSVTSSGICESLPHDSVWVEVNNVEFNFQLVLSAGRLGL